MELYVDKTRREAIRNQTTGMILNIKPLKEMLYFTA
jgi:hypothetical protein